MTRAQLQAVVRKRPKGFGDKSDTYHSDAVFLIGIDAATAMKIFDSWVTTMALLERMEAPEVET